VTAPAGGSMRFGVGTHHAVADCVCTASGMWLTGLTGPAAICIREMGTIGAL